MAITSLEAVDFYSRGDSRSQAFPATVATRPRPSGRVFCVVVRAKCRRQLSRCSEPRGGRKCPLVQYRPSRLAL